MGAVFLQETEATIVVFDMRGFSKLAATLAPLDLGLALGHFYSYAEDCVLGEGGRIVKFAGDMVLGAWLANEVTDHQRRALTAVQRAQAGRQAWLDKNAAAGMPRMEYSVAAATGEVLAGQIGTDRHKAFDVLGEPVNIAAKLTVVATMRDMDHLLMMTVPGIPAIEVEGMELGGRVMQLYRLGSR